MAQRWDIFCNVVDNYGDIGVTWRLARQLVVEHGVQVRLWVDELPSLQRLAPEIDPATAEQSGAAQQSCCRVEVRHWSKPFPEVVPADVVIEAFACELPENYVAEMAARESKPVWINLEYLSAENWVTGCHRLASPHPRLPLTKYFFFPGFTQGTGGLICEHGLLQRRQAFQRDPAALAAYWQSLGLPAPAPGELRISLFGYENKAVPDLLAAWAGADYPVICLVPEGRVVGDVSAFFGGVALAAGNTLSKGNLQVRILPFTDQDSYDQLLWACDCNFVRGEDSFVRAQWAGRPFIWQIYPQQEEAHWAKLFAFVDIYSLDLAEDAAAGLRAFWQAWNRQEGVGEAWPMLWRHHAELGAHTRRWAAYLETLGDLASNLVQFSKSHL
jgi:uncharacterized repeat protein (TIGR03837 family)